MKDRILILSESGKKSDFIKACTSVKDKGNELIDLFNQVQPWSRIETLKDFERLYDDPLKMLDQTLSENIDLKVSGNRLPQPGPLANLLGIDRAGYMATLGISEPMDIDDCPTCNKKTQTVKVNRVKQIAEFYSYAEYLYFINGTFELNNSAIDQHCQELNVYAESDEQLKLYFYWDELVKTLNLHDKKYPLSGSEKDHLVKIFKLQLSNGSTGKFVINNIQLSEQIKYLNS